jgi:hypothetical protein
MEGRRGRKREGRKEGERERARERGRSIKSKSKYYRSLSR